MKVRRLNMDASWQFSTDDTSIVVDPWLKGVEIDGFAWFNKQWHATEPVAPESLSNLNALVVTQPYADHFHAETINALPDTPLFTYKRLVSSIQHKFPSRIVKELATIEDESWTKIGDLELAFIDVTLKKPPYYYGLAIKEGERLYLLFPHGFKYVTPYLKIIQQYHLELLITSFSLFQLPFFLGGKVNPGPESAYELVRQLNPQRVYQTHDEKKHGTGLVLKLAKTYYPSPSEIQEGVGHRFVDLNHYQYQSMD